MKRILKRLQFHAFNDRPARRWLIPLSREIDEVELVWGLWPIGSRRAPPTSDELSLEDFLRRQALVLAGRISGSPFYAVRPAPTGSPADDSISAALAAFDPTQVHARWAAAMERRGSEPAGAITLARALLEDVYKWILDEAGET